MTLYRGSCHCQAIRFEVDTTIERVTACNCSICAKKGILHHRVPPESLRFLCGEDLLASYRFGTGIARHHFCPVCGIHLVTRPRAAPELYTINVRCLDDFDPASVPVVTFDGRNWEASVAQLR